MTELLKVSFSIHHQAVCECPKCGEIHIEDLGENDFADDIEMDCDCGCEFKLDSDIDS